MRNKTYQIGDIVYIKRNLTVGKLYDEVTFLDSMAQEVGKPARVISFVEGEMTPLYYKIEKVGDSQRQWFVSAEMITNIDMSLEFTADEVLGFLTD